MTTFPSESKSWKRERKRVGNCECSFLLPFPRFANLIIEHIDRVRKNTCSCSASRWILYDFFLRKAQSFFKSSSPQSDFFHDSFSFVKILFSEIKRSLDVANQILSQQETISICLNKSCLSKITHTRTSKPAIAKKYKNVQSLKVE